MVIYCSKSIMSCTNSVLWSEDAWQLHPLEHISFVPPEFDSDSNSGYWLSRLSNIAIDLLYPAKLTNLKIWKKNFILARIWIFVWFVWCVIFKKNYLIFSEHTCGRGVHPLPYPIHICKGLCVFYSHQIEWYLCLHMSRMCVRTLLIAFTYLPQSFEC